MEERGVSLTDSGVSYTVLELSPADLLSGSTGPNHLGGRRWHHQPLSHQSEARRAHPVLGNGGPSNTGHGNTGHGNTGHCCRATPSPWHGVVRSIVTQLEDTNNRVGRPQTDRPAAYLVIVRPSPGSTATASIGTRATAWRPGPVDRAIKIMEADPAAISSTADLARATKVAVRTLQAAFRQHTGTSPMQYLRELRLTRVHEDLLAADPHLHTVAKIAHRHGFTHLGRFAAAYRARYGRNPSTTLQVPTGGWPPRDRQATA
jgi:AraC-like DNA-binding protein